MNDINGYVNRMNKSIDYKKFWFDKVDTDKFDRIIDFGCGDGTLGLEILADESFDGKEVIFYETSLDMAKKLRNRLVDADQDRITIITNYELLKPLLHNERTLIVFSSVLHECYTFGTLPFDWRELRCAYIVIRDMGCPSDVHFNLIDKWKIFIHSRKKHYFDFFKRYGNSDESYLHFLLKHLYKENWDTEVLEDYFATDWLEMIGDLTVFNPYVDYKISHYKTYNIPFLVDYSKKQFNVNYNFNTHLNVIFERVDNDD